MTGDDLTRPHVQERAPVRSLRLRVVAGPEQGRLHEAKSAVVTVGSAEDNDLVIHDETVSRYHLELRAESDRVVVRDCGSTNGTMVGSVQLADGAITPGTVLRIGKTSLKVEDGEPLDEAPLFAGDDLHGLRGTSRPMRRLMAEIARAATSDASVLLLGETGTGKELIARAVHLASPRAKAPFEIVDCGALMPTLVASELFGHEKGAFTGANAQHIGAFERANGGTIFLDEIGELPLDLQVRLLGVLERRSFRRVGGTKPIDLDVRVVAATHRDLRKWVNSGEFRQDLYYRLAVVRLPIPALRERPEDIPLLVEHFVRDMGIDRPIDDVIPPVVIDSVRTYHWPGNVRELRNFVESAIALGRPPPLEDETHAHGAGGGPSFLSVPLEKLLQKSYVEARELVIQDFQAYYFRQILEQTGGNVSRAAAVAQMNRPHMIQLLKRLGIR